MNEYLNSVKEILADVKADYNATINSDTISKNTKHTKSYNLRKEIKRLTTIMGLLTITDDSKLEGLIKKDKNFKEAFLSILNPEEGGSRIIVKAGDTVLKLLQDNPGAKDVFNRALAYAEKNGLKLADDNNTFVTK